MTVRRSDRPFQPQPPGEQGERRGEHAEDIARWCDTRVALDTPVNIHLTGCHHSCAQHYCGDIGAIDLVGTGYNTLIRALRTMEKPVLAAVNGVAAGAGR